MSLVDERGRLFGWLNVVDAAAMALLLLLVPLAYAAYLLFRTPEPVIHPVTPVNIVDGVEPPEVVVTGANLPPYLRVQVGTIPATYLFESPNRAIVRLPRPQPGTYDLVFLDESVELARQANAVTVGPVAPATIMVVQLVGAFTGLTSQRANALQETPNSTKDAPSDAAIILGLNAPEPDVAVLKDDILPGVVAGRQRVPAVVRVRCAVNGGRLAVVGQSTTVVPGAVLSLPVAVGRSVEEGGTASSEFMTFYVERVYPEGTQPVTVTARVITRPPVVDLLRKSLAEPQPAPAFAALRPRLVSFNVEREVSGTMPADVREGVTSILAATFRLPAVRTAAGWQYTGDASIASADGIKAIAGVRLKAGMEFYLEMPTYRAFLQVLRIEADPRVK